MQGDRATMTDGQREQQHVFAPKCGSAACIECVCGVLVNGEPCMAFNLGRIHNVRPAQRSSGADSEPKGRKVTTDSGGYL